MQKLKSVGLALLLVAAFVLPFVANSMVQEESNGVVSGTVERIVEEKGGWLSTISFDVKSDGGKNQTFTFLGMTCDLYFGIGDKVEVAWEKCGWYKQPNTCRVIARRPDGNYPPIERR